MECTCLRARLNGFPRKNQQYRAINLAFSRSLRNLQTAFHGASQNVLACPKILLC